MFSQPPDEDHNNSKAFQNNPRRRRKKIFPHKNKHKGKRNQFKKNNSRVTNNITMSSWAENFANAATWQMKHQIAYLKAKAMALEYENKILHDFIRKNYLNESQTHDTSRTTSDHEDIIEQQTEQYEEEMPQDEEEPEGDFVVSEEFIQFLKDNAKFKEDARQERERLKAQQCSEKDIIEEMEAGPSGNQEDKEETLRKLYGDKWQRIAALEISLQSKFINDCDSDKPQYWPNIPFNFNFS